jgi:CubicO group peptidase (beta-lactamase class C family)/AcrR family transcriptional regulator
MAKPLPAHLAGTDVRQIILDSAERLLATHGYRDLTMAKLADEVGIAKGTTYLYFDSKDTLALGVIERSVERIIESLTATAAANRSAKARLIELLTARVLLRHRNFASYDKSHLGELLDVLGPRLRQRRREYSNTEIAIFARVIDEGVSRGELSPNRSIETATAMFWATEGLLPSHVGAEDLGSGAITERATRVAQLLVAGITLPRSTSKAVVRHKRQKSVIEGLRILGLATLMTLVFGHVSNAQLTRIDSLFSAYASDSTPGCAIGVDSASSKLARRAYGMASLELGVKNTIGHAYYGASIAKQFTATAILLLENDGKLRLSDPISKFIPELTGVASRVTLEQLLEHTSGIRDYPDLLVIGGHENEPVSVDRVIDLLKRQRSLNFPSGTQFAYNNGGYVLLAEVVRRASGMSFPQFINERVFTPLGMTHSIFVTNHLQLVANRAAGHRNDGKEWQVAPYVEDTYGDGGLFTTVDDLLLWGHNLETAALGGRDLVGRLTRETSLANGRKTGYGLGVEVSRYRGRMFAGHGGRSSGSQNYMMTFPAEGISIAVLCNARDIDAETYARRIAGLIFPPVTAANVSVDTTTMPIDVKQMRAVEGLYFNPQTLATRAVVVREGKLVWARGPGTIMRPQSSTKFRFPDLAGALVFSEFRNGLAQKMSIVPDVGYPTDYERAEPFTMPARGLSEYAGVYTSDEVDGKYRVEVSDNALSFNSLNSSFSFAAFPAMKDGFKGGEDVLIIFERDRAGRINGFTFSTSRARRVRFAKT